MLERIFSASEGCLNVDWNNCLNVLRNLAGMRLKEVARELELQDHGALALALSTSQELEDA